MQEGYERPHPSLFFHAFSSIKGVLFIEHKAYPKGMKKSQVLLIQLHSLLGEGLRRILQTIDDVDLVCLPCTEVKEMENCLQNLNPDMVLLAGEKEDDQATHLISTLLKHYENIPIVWVELETNRLRFFTSHTLTATSAGLINAIQKNDTRFVEMHAMDKKPRSKLQRR